MVAPLGIKIHKMHPHNLNPQFMLSGADHLLPFLHDEGACYAPTEVANATLLVHWVRQCRSTLSSPL